MLRGSFIYNLNSEGGRGWLSENRISNKAKLGRLRKLMGKNINATSFADIPSGSPLLPERPPVLLPMRNFFKALYFGRDELYVAVENAK